jgi:hypothetical protein
LEIAVPVIEVTNLLEARRAKYSQYANTGKAISLNGQMVSGLVRSVVAVPAASPTKWVVTFYQNPVRQVVAAPKVKAARRR